MLATHEDLRRKIEDMESKYDEQFRAVFKALRQLLVTEEKAERKIGFVREDAQRFGDGAAAEPGQRNASR